jgi:hypothetical protein
MKNLHTDETVDDVRRRLYSRGADVNKVERHDLHDNKIDVSRDWNLPNQVENIRNATDLRQGVVVDGVTDTLEIPAEPAAPRPRRRYRSFVLGGSLVILIMVAILSSVYIYFGGNQISSSNIAVALEGPSSIGGGETLTLNATITNNNSVPIESVTLIVNYPEGARTVDEQQRLLYEQRIPVDDIQPNETRNVPVVAAVYGEESTKEQIEATVEYRVQGSNGTFQKEVEPLTFLITSSPVVLLVDNIKQVASGQIVDVTLRAVSNASSPLRDILVSAAYPNGFDFKSSDPAPIYGENVWKIDELLPDNSFEITLRGELQGFADQNVRINFSVGQPSQTNQYVVGSVLTETFADFTIESPFIGVVVSAEEYGSNKKARFESAEFPQGMPVSHNISITNTLDETVYDMRVEMVFEGNAIDLDGVEVPQGSFDKTTRTAIWDSREVTGIERVLPGAELNLKLKVEPRDGIPTASYTAQVNVFARRVSEESAQEALIGSGEMVVKYESDIVVGAQIGRNVGRFGDSGPIPPVVGELTTYTATIVARAGVNDLSNGVVSFVLPGYVEWLEQYDADGSVLMNPITREIEWLVGDMSAGEQKEMVMQLSFTPSSGQLGSTPVLLRTQEFEATDLFTETTLQIESPAVTTELSTEMGYPEDNGRVVE